MNIANEIRKVLGEMEIIAPKFLVDRIMECLQKGCKFEKAEKGKSYITVTFKSPDGRMKMITTPIT